MRAGQQLSPDTAGMAARVVRTQDECQLTSQRAAQASKSVLAVHDVCIQQHVTSSKCMRLESTRVFVIITEYILSLCFLQCVLSVFRS